MITIIVMVTDSVTIRKTIILYSFKKSKSGRLISDEVGLRVKKKLPEIMREIA